jgi:hypothetical protein
LSIPPLVLVLQAKLRQFLRVKSSANSGVFSREDCEKELPGEMLRLEIFTYISEGEIRHVAPFWALVLMIARGFFVVSGADAIDI